MSAGTVTGAEHRGGVRERIAGGFLLVVLALACLAFWIGIPVGALWALGEVTDSFVTHFVLALLGVPLLMAAFALVLFWLNGLYLRVTGVLARMVEDERESGWHRRVRGPLEPMLLTSFVLALIALCIWFFVFAENPSPQVI
jgi:ABC-type dipeptide/oligopeptide/nickel transport system permease component